MSDLGHGIKRFSEEWFLVESVYMRNISRPGATDEGVRNYIRAIFSLPLGS